MAWTAAAWALLVLATAMAIGQHRGQVPEPDLFAEPDANIEYKAKLAARKIQTRICLNMIAKDEVSGKLNESLAAAARHISGYVFCDTGSSDGTPEVAKAYFDSVGIDGVVLHHNWSDFSSNRNLCMTDGTAAMGEACDYWLLLDADQIMVLEGDDDNDPESSPKGISELKLTAPSYWLRENCHGTVYSNRRLVSTASEWRYHGRVHEYIAPEEHTPAMEVTGSLPKAIHSLHHSDFGRGFQRDAELLEEDVATDPKNMRAWFYLGNTYRALNRREDAMRAWVERIRLGGWEEEQYNSALEVGKMLYRIWREARGNKSVSLETWQALKQVRLVSRDPPKLDVGSGRPALAIDEDSGMSGHAAAAAAAAEAKAKADAGGDPEEDDEYEENADEFDDLVELELNDALTALRTAHSILPYRAEAPFIIAKAYRIDMGDLTACAGWTAAARLGGPTHDKSLFVDGDVYRFKLLDEQCVCSYGSAGSTGSKGKIVGLRACRDLVAALDADGVAAKLNRGEEVPSWKVDVFKRAKANVELYTRWFKNHGLSIDNIDDDDD